MLARWVRGREKGRAGVAFYRFPSNFHPESLSSRAIGPLKRALKSVSWLKSTTCDCVTWAIRSLYALSIPTA